MHENQYYVEARRYKEHPDKVHLVVSGKRSKSHVARLILPATDDAEALRTAARTLLDLWMAKLTPRPTYANYGTYAVDPERLI